MATLTLLRRTLLPSSIPPPLSTISVFPRPFQNFRLNRSFVRCSSLAMDESTYSTPTQSKIPKMGGNVRWKPMCLYYTQGKCTKMEDPMHLQKFCHSCTVGFETTGPALKKLSAQEFDYFLVVDLEGKVEILEFPVLLFDVKAMDVVDVFHRFVRPTEMSEKRTNEYIEGKYGKFGVDGVWHDTAIIFEEVIEQFESWLRKDRGDIKLWREDGDGRLNGAAFVTCGNWDLKTKVPQQCEVSRMNMPPYFMEWINLKDIYLNFYNRRAPGMLSMMNQLRILPLGSHHLGIDDTKNIVRVMHRLINDGARLQITAKRTPHGSPERVKFMFENRI